METTSTTQASDVAEASMAASMPPNADAVPPSPSRSRRTYGEHWASAFGICNERERPRYAQLKETLVFKMDAVGSADPLTAFMEQHASTVSTTAARRLPQRIVRGSIMDDSDESDESDDASDTSDPPLRSTSHTTAALTSISNTHNAAHNASDPTWATYFSDETLLYEINTDLERLYPSGHEQLFQRSALRAVLRDVLFVWCKLHADVSYRQGMHDVAAVVLYAFLITYVDDSDGDKDDDAANPFGSAEDDKDAQHTTLPVHVEADVFSVFEAVMLYLKPLYAVAHASSQSLPPRSATPAYSTSSSTTKQPNEPALSRLCRNIQYELLQQTDPQLFYHLQNLEIVPETYCLRWLRLLLAREFDLDVLLCVWDSLICDSERRTITYLPNASDGDDVINQLPQLEAMEGDDASWTAFPLLRYVCLAKLLALSPQLRAADNTGCWRLLMQAAAPLEESDNDLRRQRQSAIALLQTARVLRHPLSGACDTPERHVDIVEFHAGPLGIVLTSVTSGRFRDRLAVKELVVDDNERPSQAQASGRVFVHDILESINGVRIIHVTTEDVKRHLQLIQRPMFLGFLHPTPIAVDNDLENDVVDAPLTDAIVQPLPSPSLLLLPGEMCYAHVETSVQRIAVTLDGASVAHNCSGTLVLTNYRCLFVMNDKTIDWQVPVLSIAAIDSIDSTTSSSNGSAMSATNTPQSVGSASLSAAAAAFDHAQAVFGFTSAPSEAVTPSLSTSSSNAVDVYSVVLRCKDTQTVRLTCSTYGEYSKLTKCLQHVAFPSSLLDAFCFSYKPSLAPSDQVPFDLVREYERLGLLDDASSFRCIDQTSRYALCDTYPQHLIVPSAMTDAQLHAAAAFRSGNRLPVVAWRHRTNGAVISRASQPLVGLKSARSSDDERLVHLLCGSSSTDYVIMDARSQLAAVGNKALGKGTEIISNYKRARLVFMNLDNIHTVRQSAQSLTGLFDPRTSQKDDAPSFWTKVEASGWLRHVRLVLKASVELAIAVDSGVSVLTHCSDGWDRTAQMVALAELLLDPFYRTLRGFAHLVEKEWCAFGHQFGLRCGHARRDATHDQRAPIFLLWLDCVWQVVRQQPLAFEFNEKLLLAIADHVYACKYGTFMFDSEKQRKEIFAKHRVVSIWSDVNSNAALFTSPLFAPSASSAVALVVPSTLSKNIKLWKGYFCRWDSTIVPPVPAFQYY